MSRTIKIGRSHDNDYIIDNQHVSRHHAEMTITDDNRCALLRDVGSTAGTYVNGKKITGEITVTQNDKIAFGDAIVSFSAIANAKKKTRVAPSNPIGGMSIGRSDDCQIRLMHDDVSSHHAVLNKLPNGSIEIVDTNSSNGTFVNGERITRCVLAKGDRVTITRNYTLDWEQYFPNAKMQTTLSFNSIQVAAAIVGIICLLGICYFLFQNRTWDTERIYEEYSSAVCMVFGQYGFKVFIDGEDWTNKFCEDNYMYVDESKGKIIGGKVAYTGTGFFISEDGRIATNLHIARSYLFEKDKEIISSAVNKLANKFVSLDPQKWSRANIEVKGYTTEIGVIPNGQRCHGDNYLACSEYNAGDDTNIDVAIIQTVSRTTPTTVKKIIDIADANFSEDALKEGRTVFTIGFPLGTDAGLDTNKDLRNQVHSGSITQHQGAYSFGHDAEVTHGASGSPIFNDKGQLIGVANAGFDYTQGFNSGIKAKYLIELNNK